MLSFLRLSFLPSNVDLGLLVLRVISGGSMLWLHGKGKLEKFKEMKDTFSPIVINSQVSYGLTIFAEVLCAGLLVIGLFGRLAALALAITMGVAFFMVHKMKLSGEGSGEMPFLYLMAFATLFFSGPGKFSVDGGGK